MEFPAANIGKTTAEAITAYETTIEATTAAAVHGNGADDSLDSEAEEWSSLFPSPSLELNFQTFPLSGESSYSIP